MTQLGNPYRELVVPCVLRARTLMNGAPGSSAAGSADRGFWLYRTQTDFRSGSWQQLMLGFAALATVPGDPELDTARLVGDAKLALFAWLQAQHRDGSVDEWFRNEHSFCATAFGLAGAAQAALLLGDRIGASEHGRVIAGLGRAGAWLKRHANPDVMNQNLAAAVGLWCFGVLTGEASWRRAAEEKLGYAASHQHADGWYSEYGGMDFGYSSLALDLLAAAHRWGMEAAAAPAERLAGFLDRALGPLGVVPGRLGSRGTCHAFAYGAEHFAGRFESARRLAIRFRQGHEAGLLPRPVDTDDRYFAYFYFPQFALAYAAAAGKVLPSSADRGVGDVGAIAEEGSGLVTRSAGQGRVYFSRRLGGAIAIEAANGILLYHLGYEIGAASGARYSSASWTRGSLPAGTDAAVGLFQRVSDARPLERMMVPFAIFVRFLALPGAAGAFNALIKKTMIRPKSVLDGRLDRQVRFTGEMVTIRDEITLSRPQEVVSLDVAREIAMHSPSARIGDKALPIELADPDARLAELRRDGRTVIEWRLPPAGAIGTVE